MRLKVILLSALTVFLSALPVPSARADIMLMPVRVLFDEHNRMANIMVLNTGDTTATFRLGWLYQMQVEGVGTYKTLDTAPNPALDPGKWIVFSPRQVTLPPGERQRVRLSLRRPADMPDGEYHVHLELKRLDGRDPLSPKGLKERQAKAGMSINIGFGIPVIIRQGQNDADASLGTPRFVAASGNNPAAITLTITRSGKFGTMGNLRVFWTPAGGNERFVGVVNNFNIFSEITRREAYVTLSVNQIPNGTIRVVYEGDGPDKGKTFDEKSFPVGG